jgi:hypothetical protein
VTLAQGLCLVFRAEGLGLDCSFKHDQQDKCDRCSEQQCGTHASGALFLRRGAGRRREYRLKPALFLRFLRAVDYDVDSRSSKIILSRGPAIL